MKVKFYFSILRYMFDPLTQEFVNIGVVLYSPEHRYIGSCFTSRYSRVTRMFGHIDGMSVRAITKHIEHRIFDLGESIERGRLFDDPNRALQSFLAEILPVDDTSIRFAPGGVGITDDPGSSLKSIFDRYVSRYESPNEIGRRNEDDVWKSFQESLKTKRIFSHLIAKKISAPNYEYEFKRSWKNGKWHLFEPVSFDLVDESSILEKANRWVGRTTGLSDCNESFKLFLLLGEPTDPTLGGAFRKAKNLLSKIQGERELIMERDAEEFANQVEEEFRQHELSPEL